MPLTAFSMCAFSTAALILSGSGAEICVELVATAQVVLAAEALDCLYASIKKGGAVVEEQEAVVSVDRKNKIVVTESGAEYQYDKLIVCCGPWTNQVCATALKSCATAAESLLCCSC